MVDGITDNEAKVMEYLLRNPFEQMSINEIANRLDLSPQGAMKILRKLEEMHLAQSNEQKHGKFYKPNLISEPSVKMAQYLLLKKELNNYARVYAEDMKQFRIHAKGCAIFGSVLEKGKDAKDIDVLFIIEKDQFKKLHKALGEYRELVPKKIHDIMVSPEELIEGIRGKNPVFLDILKKGAIIWGSDYFVGGLE